MNNNILEKARINPDLVLVHIIDKNGLHKVVYKKREEIQPGVHNHKHVEEVKEGDVVHVGEEKFTLKRNTRDGYLDVVNQEGRKLPKSIKKIKFSHPLTNEEKTGSFTEDENASPEVKTTSTTTESKKQDSTSEETEEQRQKRYEEEGTPAERMQDWVHLINNFANDTSKNLTVAYGTGGVGKTFNVLKNKKIKEGLDSGEYVKYTGGTTAAGFFEMLYENRNKKIILDDFDMVFKDPNMLGILSTISRSSNERMLTNPASGATTGDIPNRFKFEGKLMIISNIDIDKEAEKSGGSSQKYKELLVNANKVDLKMTKRETWDLLNDFILHSNGEINKNLKFQDAYGSELEIPVENRQELSEYFASRWQDMKELSGRTLTKANAIQSFYKSIGNNNWQAKADEFLLEKGNPNVTVQERFKDFNDSIDMIAEGKLKSAVVVANNSDQVVEALKEKGFYNSTLDDNVTENEFDRRESRFTLQRQSNPNYIPRPDEKFATESYITITGSNLTERKLYETLWEHNGKVIIFDKTARNFLKSDLGQGLLKGALDTSGDGELAWLSKTNTGKYPVPKKEPEEDQTIYAGRLQNLGFEFDTDDNGVVDASTITHPYDIPKSFQFKGRCVFITDSYDDAPQPIQSRSMMSNVSVSPEEFLELTDSIVERRERLGYQFSNLMSGITSEDYRKAADFLKQNKDKVNQRHFSQEGIETIINNFVNKPEGETEEQMNKRLLRTLRKSLLLEDLNPEAEIFKAFNSLF